MQLFNTTQLLQITRKAIHMSPFVSVCVFSLYTLFLLYSPVVVMSSVYWTIVYKNHATITTTLNKCYDNVFWYHWVPGGGGGAELLPIKLASHAWRRKHVNRVVLKKNVRNARYVFRGSRWPKITNQGYYSREECLEIQNKGSFSQTSLNSK